MYMLWNTELEIFEYKTEREVRGSLHDHIDMITKAGSREYVVQPGEIIDIPNGINFP